MTSNIRCENHPERPYLASFLNIAARTVRFFCWDCAVEYRKTITTPYKGKREAWETNLNAERDYQRRTYGISDHDIGDPDYNRRWK